MTNSIEDRALFALIAICFLLLIAVFFIIVIVGLFKRRQTEYRQEKIALQAQYQQEILQAQLEIQHQTLQQIGQDLHDNIGQLLSVMSLNLHVLEEEVTDAKIKGQIVGVSEILQQTISGVRGLSRSLDSDFVMDFGLVESLSYELQRIRNSGKYQTEIVVEGKAYRLEGKKEIVLFRIAQEILNNILKHSEASMIKVCFGFAPHQFSLELQDDGKGFDYEAAFYRDIEQTGVGLRNIKRRIEILGGSCHFITAEGQGTIVRVELPISPKIP
jgi:two-component system NarL family sensor kinase